jgi:hypothetical protein
MNGEDEENHPPVAKADTPFGPVAARLKPCPFKTARNQSFSAASKACPSSAGFMRALKSPPPSVLKFFRKV